MGEGFVSFADRPVDLGHGQLHGLLSQLPVAFDGRDQGHGHHSGKEDPPFRRATATIRWYSWGRCRAKARNSSSVPNSRGCSLDTACRVAVVPFAEDVRLELDRWTTARADAAPSAAISRTVTNVQTRCDRMSSSQLDQASLHIE